MIVERLIIEQYRGFEARTVIELGPSWTILVGENGVGKTSLLWALRVLLSRTLPRLTKSKLKALRFTSDDIAKGWPFLRAEMSVLLSDRKGVRATCIAQANTEQFIKSGEAQGRPREHALDTPDRYDVKLEGVIPGSLPGDSSAPLVVYYSAHRSLAMMDRTTNRARAGVGISAAYAGALDDRELRLGEAAELWRKESTLEVTDGRLARANRAIELALPQFLGDFRNIRVQDEKKPRLVVDKRNTTLDLSQLSDGERGLLAVLIDLTRRLAIVNPVLEQPARDGSAVVLIDELDLHMHPRWQRTIISRLSSTFPKCQFIATTHSPQIISEVQPDRLLLLRQDSGRIIPEKCGQAYGLDASYVLEHIMGTPPRAEPATAAINAVEDALENGDLELARARLNALRSLLHGDDPVVVGLNATINNLEALGNAADSQEE
jgi:predicted ATP-binding protein involved in virulence